MVMPYLVIPTLFLVRITCITGMTRFGRTIVSGYQRGTGTRSPAMATGEISKMGARFGMHRETQRLQLPSHRCGRAKLRCRGKRALFCPAMTEVSIPISQLGSTKGIRSVNLDLLVAIERSDALPTAANSENHRLSPSVFRHSLLLASRQGIGHRHHLRMLRTRRDLSSTKHPLLGPPLLATLALLCIRNTPPQATS